MSFLEYLGGDHPDRRPPERVYATLDREASALDDDAPERWIVFDAVEADWFDTAWQGVPWLEHLDGLALSWRVSILQVRGMAADRAWRAAAEAEWVQLELSNEPSEDVLHYVNLFAAPDEQRLESVDPLPSDIEDQLREAHSLAPLEDASEDALDDVLARAVGADVAAVYDVGQGACNALIGAGAPLLYFDFGGGCLWNAFTYPTRLTNFCFTSHPPVVLSHWDYDHWATANRDPAALQQLWIVPRQGSRLAPSHLSFLLRLLASSPAVLVWPSTLASLTSGALTVERCAGNTRNGSGLALVWRQQTGPGRMLFPADAAYDHIPSAASGDFTTLVASHHGGRTHSTFVPPPDGMDHGRLVYSYGNGNTYGHPLDPEEQMHRQLWGVGKRTPALQNLGHVHLYWDSHQPNAHSGCRGIHCQLDCCQR